MLQKIVNGIAIASGVVSLTVVGAAGYVFIRKDAIIENIKSKVMESVLPGGLGGLGGYVFIRKDAIIENVKGKIMESVMPGGMSGILGGGDAGTGALEGLGLPPLGF